MTLSESLTTTDGDTYEMAGVLPADIEMQDRYQALDHVELEARSDTAAAKSRVTAEDTSSTTRSDPWQRRVVRVRHGSWRRYRRRSRRPHENTAPSGRTVIATAKVARSTVCLSASKDI